MNDFIQTFLSELDTGRLKAVLNLLDDARVTGLIRTREEFDRELERLAGTLKTEPWASSYTPEQLNILFDPVIHSEFFNKAFEGVYFDLVGLFRHISRLGNSVTSHDRILTSEVMAAKDTVKRLLEDAGTYQFLKSNPEWNEVKYNTFVVPKNLSMADSIAEVDPKVAQLTLPVGNVQVVTDKRGSTGASISVDCISAGSGGNTYGSFKPENALDGLRDSFWVDLLLTDKPVVTRYNNTNYQGAVVEVTLSFACVEYFNVVKLLPFGVHPMRVIDILISDDRTDYTRWAGFEANNPTLDWLCFREAPAAAAYMKIVLLQENYTHANYLIPKEMIDRTRLWDHIVNSEVSYLGREGDILPQDERARLVDKDINTLIDAQEMLDDRITDREVGHGSTTRDMSHKQRARNLTGVLFNNTTEDSTLSELLPGESGVAAEQPKLVEVDKYEYVYGLRVVSVSNVQYVREGEYRSPRYVPKGNPINIRLRTDETHESVRDPVGNLWPATSIEYSLELDANKTLPIMPEGTVRIFYEPIRIDRVTLSGQTRFYPSFADYDGATHTAISIATPEVWLHDKALEEGIDYTLSWNGRIELTGYEMQLNRVSVLLVSYNVGTYTCSDSSDPAAIKTAEALYGDLDIDSLLPATHLIKPLVFNGTNDRGKLELSYYPHISKKVVESEGDDDSPWDRPDKLDGIWYPRRTAGVQHVAGKWYGTAVGYVRDVWLITPGNAFDNFLYGQPCIKIEMQAFGGAGPPFVSPVDLGFPDGVTARKQPLPFPPPVPTYTFSEPYEVIVGTAVMTCYTVCVDVANDFLLLPISGMGLHDSSVYDAALDFHPYKKVTLNGLPYYEPILVHVEGNKAKNITDYYSGQNPGFARTAQSELEYQYVHVGRKLYFNRPLKDTEIRVLFAYKAAYVQLIATLRNTPLGGSRVTPVLHNFKLAMQTARR